MNTIIRLPNDRKTQLLCILRMSCTVLTFEYIKRLNFRGSVQQHWLKNDVKSVLSHGRDGGSTVTV